MTPEQVSALESSLTPTTESPTKVGWYWVAGGIWLRFVFVWTNDTCDGIFRTGSGPGVPVRDDYEGHTWTGPINLAAMLQAIGQWRIDVEDGIEKNGRLHDETIELAKELHDETIELVKEVERLEGQRDFLMRGLQDMQNRLGKLRDRAAEYRIYRAPVEATEQVEGDKETLTNEQQVATKRLQLYGNLFSACDKSQADRAAKAEKGK